MIRFKKVTQQTVLLLTIGLLAPLYGSAPANGGAGAGSSVLEPGRTATAKPGDKHMLAEDTESDSDTEQPSQLKKQRTASTPATEADHEPVAAAYAAPANGGAGAETAVNRYRFCAISDDLHRTTTSYLSASDQAALATTNRSERILFKQKLADITAKLLIPAGIDLTDEEKKLCAQCIFKNGGQQPNSNRSYKITLPWAMKQLTTATAANNAAQIAILNRIVIKFIDVHHTQYRTAFQAANTALTPITATTGPADRLTAARGLLATINAENVLNRLALCFVWNTWFPGAESLDINIPLNEMIERSADDNLQLNFARINQLGNQEKIAQEIVNFVLTLMRPTALKIYSASGALAFVSYELQTLFANDNPRLTALDLSSCPQLETLAANNNPLLTTLDLSSCPHLEILGANNNPRLTTLDLSSCPQLRTLGASYNLRLTALDLYSCHQLQDLEAYDNPRLTALDLSNCPQLKSLWAYGNPLLATLDLSSCPQLQTLFAHCNPLLTTLNVSNCHQLKYLLAYDNHRLTRLDLSNCHQLHNLLVAHANPFLADLRLPATTPHLHAAVRESQRAIVAANRARIAAEQAEEDRDLGGFASSCSIQ